VAVLYLATFASLRLYGLVPPLLALALMVAICALSTAIALLQNSRALAVIGFAGGFITPILVSTGQGNHVVLFSYYLLLNLAIMFIAFKRAWRLLNVVGFVMTFGIATAWGALRYQPENYASTQPFLIAFFLIYVATALLYARRQATKFALSASGAVDGTLVFGTPLAAFGLQAGLVGHWPFALAYSALALGGFYLVAAWLMARRIGNDARLLLESFAAIGLGFATLAVPLALDARWTAAVWAVEGAGIFWLGMRQSRWLPRAFGLLLQGIAALAFIASVDGGVTASLPFANPAFIGALLLALPAFAIAWWTRTPLQHAGGMFAKAYGEFEAVIEKPAFLIGFFWWCAAFAFEVARRVPGDGVYDAYAAIEPIWQTSLTLMAFVLSAFAAQRLGRRLQWPVARWPAYLTAPAVLALTLAIVIERDIVSLFGSMIFGAGFLTPLLTLRHADADAPKTWFNWMHALTAWTVMLAVANALDFLVVAGGLQNTSWASVVFLVTATGVLGLLAVLPQRATLAARWPFDRFGRSYQWLAAVPLAALVFIGALVTAAVSRGNAAPLPYVPLLNPTDLAIALALGAIMLWIRKLRDAPFVTPEWIDGVVPKAALAFAGFIAINTVWLRVAHHFGGVPWDAGSLSGSFLVQTGYSILWTLLALGLMVFAHRRALRAPWTVGAGLLGLTVAKLLLVDLSNSGGGERIVAFIVVGVLVLLIGFFAPLPPATHRAQPAPEAAA
jgi:uncharacterized membrane protein